MKDRQSGPEQGFETDYVPDGGARSDGTDSYNAGDWQDSNLPVDDFQDGESKTTVEEAEGAQPDPFTPDSGTDNNKKRGQLIFFGVIGFAALFLLGMIYLQFSGDSSSSSPAISLLENGGSNGNGAEGDVAVDTGTIPPADISEKPMAIDNSKVTAIPSQVAELPPESPVLLAPQTTKPLPVGAAAPKTDLVSSMYAEGQPIASSTNGTTTVTPGIADDYIKNTTPPPVTAPPVASTTVTPSVVGQIPDVASRASAASLAAAAEVASANGRRLDSMESNLASATRQMDDMKRAIEQLTGQISTMATRLDAAILTAKQAQAMVVPVAPIVIKEPEPVVSSPQVVESVRPIVKVEKEKLKPVKKAKDEPAPAPKKTIVNNKTTTPSPASATPVATKTLEVKWVLRSATPDAAWVAASSTSTTLKKIVVGETIPGLGKVTSIAKVGNKWVVTGSEGTAQ